MAVLLMRLAGPMQSWGTRSRFTDRDTELFPTKSGVVGILAAALGRRRYQDIDDLAQLSVAVRIDAPGTLERDYQTALRVAKANGSAATTLVSTRHYLSDASFLVALEGEAVFLGRLDRALASPRFPLFLGRRSYVPGEPIRVSESVLAESAEAALGRFAWPHDEPSLDALVETDGHADILVRDVPVSFRSDDRRYRVRSLRRLRLQRPDTTEMPCS